MLCADKGLAIAEYKIERVVQMNETLFKAFRGYLNLVSSSFINTKEHSVSTKKHLSLYSGASVIMEEYERSSEFNQLVEESQKESSFVSLGSLKDKRVFESAIQSFFRRSGCYNAIIENKPINIDALFEKYIQAFQETDIQLTYLVPMGLVSFQEELMDFGSFQIRRFPKRELFKICQSKINKVFYQYAHIPPNQMDLLQYCWFICITEKIPRSKKNPIFLFDFFHVKTEYTLYPSSVEFVLKKLALFDWTLDIMEESPFSSGQKEEDDGEERLWQRWWKGFEVPFIIVVDDDLLTSPQYMPDVSKLSTEPFIDAETGEEIGETLTMAILFDEEETTAFKYFIRQIEGIFNILTPLDQKWKFLEVSLGFFVKAFFSKGLEQLLWHITTLEALLGKNEYGSTKRLASRISSICGETNEKRENIKNQFLELYDFRCDLVHGNNFQKKQVYVGHLYRARLLARQTLLWFLYRLKEIKEHLQSESGNSTIPTRDDILSFIDKM